jgi:hypothetical protein
LPAINNLEAFPVDASDAAPMISPGDARSEGQFFLRVLICSGPIGVAPV